MDGIRILRKLISFDTTNDPTNNKIPKGNIIEYLELLLKEWNPDLESKIFDMNNYKSIYFAPSLKIPVDILFMGHLDVVPVSKGWNSNPFDLKIENDIGYGRGTKDCKGSIVSSLLAFKSLLEEKNLVTQKLGLFFSSDEETGGQYGAKMFFEWLKQENLSPICVINVDGGPRVVNKRRGGFGVKINLPVNRQKMKGRIISKEFTTRILEDDNRHSAYFVKGCDTHAAINLSKYLHLNRNLKVRTIHGSWIKGNVIPDQITVELINPDEKSTNFIKYDENLTQILTALRSIILLNVPTEIFSEFGITVNPNIISYTKTEGTTIYFDVRLFLDSKEKELLIESFKTQLGSLKAIATISCPGTSGYFYTDETSRLVCVSENVLHEYNLISDSCEQEGASDSRYTNGIPVIDLGPFGGNIHGSNEFINLKSLELFSNIYKEIIKRLVTEVK